MAGHTANPQVLRACGATVERWGRLQGHAELMDVLPGGDIRVSVRLHVRVDANGNIRSLAQELRPAFNQLELTFRFKVEHQDTGLQRSVYFRLSFAHTREHNTPGVRTHFECTAEFPTGNDIEPGARLVQELQNSQTGIGLD